MVVPPNVALRSTIMAAYLELQHAQRHGTDAALSDAVASVLTLLETALSSRTLSKTRAARELGMPPSTLDYWIERGHLPTVLVDGYKQQRIPVLAVAMLAAAINELRAAGRQRGLLVEALARLDAENQAWRQTLDDPCGGASREHFDRTEYVSADPGPEWAPED